MSDNALVPASNIIVPSISDYAIFRMNPAEVAEILKDNLGGDTIAMSDLDTIKVPTGGSTTWEIPTAKGIVETKAFSAIIVFWTQPRAYWVTEYNGEQNAPDCFSDDSTCGIGEPGGDCSILESLRRESEHVLLRVLQATCGNDESLRYYIVR
jgi:hypothetical protein